MAVRSIPSPLPAYPGRRGLTTRIPSWGRRHRWAGLDDPGPDRTVNDGTVVVVGTGAARQYSWAHGLGAVPAHVHVDHPLSLPLPGFALAWDATNITVRFDSAPARNIDLRWFVQAPDVGVTAPGRPLAGEPLITENGVVLITENGVILTTEGTTVGTVT